MEPRPSLDNLKRTFVPPAELGTSRPRNVRLTAGGQAVVAATVVLLLAAMGVGTGMYRTAVRQAGERRAMAVEGVDTSGVVTRLWRGTDKEKQPWVSYRFAADGREFEGRVRISLSRWKSLQAGSPVPVRYLLSDPSRNFAAGRPPGVLPLWAPFVVAAAFCLLGVLCVVLIQIQRRLLMEGRVAPAVVTGHATHHTSHGGTFRSMTYMFPLLSGAAAKGKSNASGKLPVIGSVICVVYDPERPRRNQPYPLSLVRASRG